MGLNQSISKRCADPSKYATADAPGSKKDSSRWKTYDFVIVGGGTAGCVLAARLSENPNVSVLLLEAGNSHEGNLISPMPFTFVENFFTDADWAFYLAPQKKCNDRKMHYPRGKILGGTSSINAAIYHHCAPEDFDLWAERGAEGWNYEELRPYFLKAEGYVPNSLTQSDKEEEHGTSGPIKTRKPIPIQDINRLVIETAKNMGIPARSDLNTNGTLGVSAFLATVNEKGRRSSTAVSYLTPDVLKRPNLTVAVNCRVERLVFDEKTGPKPRAIGVEFRCKREGSLYRVAGKKEVLVCGGAVASPHILLLSGLGPRNELEKKGIEVVKDLPAVGKHFTDHVSAGTFNLQAKPGTTYDYLNNPLHALLAVARWYFTGTGVISELSVPGAIFVRSADPCIPTNDPAEIPVDLSTGPNAPDLEILWIPLTAVDNGMTKASSKVKGVTLSPIALQPKSVGEITLATNSAWDQPIIDANLFDDDNDMKVILRGLRLIFKLAHSEPFASMLELNPKPDYPFFLLGCTDPDNITDGELREWVRKNACPTFHPGCSCRMGTSEDSSVVNNKLQVHGVDSLRIIDASIFPTLVSGHPCAPVVAVAEKASDMIKQQYGL